MFDFGFVILPFSDVDPGEAIRASLARYERGRAGEVPDEWLTFDDETLFIREAHEAGFTFSRSATGGLSIRGATHLAWLIDSARVTAEMDRRGLSTWTIRFDGNAWPVGGPAEAFVWLGLAPEASWADVVEASLERFSDHWVAGVAYHL